MRLPYYTPWSRCLRHGTEPLGVAVRSTQGLVAQNIPICVVQAYTLRHRTQVHYNKASSREGMLNRALFRAAVSLPPASARSGRPPPEPPTCLASACISLPAWTLAVRSLVTPAIRATFPSSGMPSATTPDPSFCRRLSTSCLSPSRSTFCTSAAITLIPLTTCTRPASSSIWLKAPLRQIDERSEEHTSELQSRQYLVCRLLLEKKKQLIKPTI